MFPEPQDLAGPTPSSGGVVGSPLALEQFRRLGTHPRRKSRFPPCPRREWQTAYLLAIHLGAHRGMGVVVGNFSRHPMTQT